MGTTLNVLSYWVHRPDDFPDAPDYLSMLHALDKSCARLGFKHIVLTDPATAPMCRELVTYECELPRDLMQATTEVQARWLESEFSSDADNLFVGADCLVLKEFRPHLAKADLSIVLRPKDKRYRINNGFMFVPKASRRKASKLFRRIARDTVPVMCDDMAAIERALSPMPAVHGVVTRGDMKINFVPMEIWNAGPKRVDNSAHDAFVLHFRGAHRKTIMLDWAARWLT